MKPEVSIPVGLATAAVVYGIYSNATPTIADIRVGPAQDQNIDASRKMASWTAAVVVSGISLIAKDPTVFIIGGAMVVALDWWTRHANAINPDTGTIGIPVAAGNASLMTATPDIGAAA
jgi:hypothetical protein